MWLRALYLMGETGPSSSRSVAKSGTIQTWNSREGSFINISKWCMKMAVTIFLHQSVLRETHHVTIQSSVSFHAKNVEPWQDHKNIL
jgi:hypothetical protein